MPAFAVLIGAVSLAEGRGANDLQNRSVRGLSAQRAASRNPFRLAAGVQKLVRLSSSRTVDTGLVEALRSGIHGAE